MDRLSGISCHRQNRAIGAGCGLDQGRPTTIGRRLRWLEARLGLTLFEQTRDGQVLTEAGEAVLVEVEAMDLSASKIREASASGNVPVGTIRVSCSEGLGSVFIAPRLTSFFERYPSIKLDLVASNGFLSSSKREADLVIVLSRPSTGAVIASKLSDYALRLYASRQHFSALNLPENSEELISGHRLAGYIPDLLYAPELNYLAEISPKLEANLRSSSINAQHRLIASGLAIGVLPCFIGDADPNLISVFAERRIMRSFWVVTHRDTHKLSRIQAFKRRIIDEVQSAGQSLFCLSDDHGFREKFCDPARFAAFLERLSSGAASQRSGQARAVPPSSAMSGLVRRQLVPHTKRGKNQLPSDRSKYMAR